MNIFLHIGFFVSFAFALVSMLLGAFSGQTLPLLSFVFLYGGLLISRLPDSLSTHGKLRALFFLLGAALAAVGFAFLPRQSAFYAFYTLLLLLAALLSWKLRYEPRHESFLSAFRFSCVAAAVLLCIILLICSTGSSERLLQAEDALGQVLPILLVMLSGGILTLRGLRAAEGAVNRVQLERRQLLDCLSFFALCALCFTLQPWRWVIALMDAVYQWLLDPLEQGMDSLFDRVYTLIRNPNSSLSGGSFSSGEAGGSSTPAASAPAVSEPSLTDPGAQEVPNSAPMTYVYIAFLLILLAVALVLLICKLRKVPRSVRSYPNEEREELAPEEGRKASVSRFHRAPRLKIRYCYQSFLRRLRAKNAGVCRSDTCLEISERAAIYTQNHEALEELTGLYRKARYCDSEAPTADDAARAKALSKKV